MISTFQRNQDFRKMSVNKAFTHVQKQKKAMSPRHSAYIPSCVKSPLYLYKYLSSLVPMVDQKIKCCHFLFECIFYLKEIIEGSV